MEGSVRITENPDKHWGQERSPLRLKPPAVPDKTAWIQRAQSSAGNQAMQHLLRGRADGGDSRSAAALKSPVLDASVAATAREGAPTSQVAAPNVGDRVDVYDTPAAHQAAARMGVHGFSYRGEVFLGSGLEGSGLPGRRAVVEHEVTHALQAREDGPTASRDALEQQASGDHGQGSLLAADKEAVYGFLWIPFVIGFGYMMLKSNTANAPTSEGSPTYPSMTTADYIQTAGEAAILASGGLVAGAVRRAGYSVVTSWAVSGGIGSMGFRAVGDIAHGTFSGVKTYVIDGFTGAVVGVVVGGTFYALGRAPGLSRVRDWYQQGAENDAGWRQLSAREKLLYEIGQKTLPPGQYEPLEALSPVERGRQIVQQRGWLGALLPRSGKFLVPGAGGTLSTGPTPGIRQWFPRVMGSISGAVGRHAVLPDWEQQVYNALLPDRRENTHSTQHSELFPANEMNIVPNDDLDALPEAAAPSLMDIFLDSAATSASRAGIDPTQELIPEPGSATVIVVPEGRQMEYYLKTGQVGDFPPDALPPGQRYG